MFKKSENHNINYCAKIIKLGEPVKHKQADRLQGWLIDHNRVWTNMDYNEGDTVVYFPLECCINPELLSYLNLFRDKTKNSNPEEAGFFDDNGRVRALKLRGEPSEGFLLPLQEVLDWLSTVEGTTRITEPDDNQEFDCYISYVDETPIQICKKYIPKNSRVQGTGNKSQAKKKLTEQIVEGQFNLHRDTEQLKKHIDEVNPGDIISITYKLHGTSAVFSNILVKRVLSRFERFLKWCGVNIQETKYGNVYSSRTVIKDVDGIKHSEGGFYGTDIWGIVNDEIKDKILQGYSIYGEIVGFLPDGKAIQSKYDYGCEPNQHAFYVYRITHTNPEGHVHELGWQDLKDYCNKFGLNHVPEMYFGKAINHLDFFQEIENDFSGILLQELMNRYLEKDCHMCSNKVPAEGIVLRIEKGNKPAFKLKSFRFLGMESEQLDTGEIDLESQESQTE